MSRRFRRSTLDVRLGRVLAVQQIWTELATGDSWRVVQVHRADCQVELEHAGRRILIRFEALRTNYERDPVPALEAA